MEVIQEMRGLKSLLDFKQFSKTHSPEIIEFCRQFTIRQLQPNELILDEANEDNDKLFIVLRGKVGVFNEVNTYQAVVPQRSVKYFNFDDYDISQIEEIDEIISNSDDQNTIDLEEIHDQISPNYSKKIEILKQKRKKTYIQRQTGDNINLALFTQQLSVAKYHKTQFREKEQQKDYLTQEYGNRVRTILLFQVFGESTTCADEVKKANTFVALEKCDVLIIKLDQYKLMKQTFDRLKAEQREQTAFIYRIFPFFKEKMKSKEQRDWYIQDFIKVEYKWNQKITTEGEKGNFLYIIFHGELTFSKNFQLSKGENIDEVDINQEIVLNHLGPENILGEELLLDSNEYQYTTVCKSDKVILLQINAAKFKKIFPVEIISRVLKNYEMKLTMIEKKFQEYLQKNCKKIYLNKLGCHQLYLRYNIDFKKLISKQRLPTFTYQMQKDFKQHYKQSLSRMNQSTKKRSFLPNGSQKLDLSKHRYNTLNLMRPYFNRTFHPKSNIIRQSKEKDFIISLDGEVIQEKKDIVTKPQPELLPKRNLKMITKKKISSKVNNYKYENILSGKIVCDMYYAEKEKYKKKKEKKKKVKLTKKEIRERKMPKRFTFGDLSKFKKQQNAYYLKVGFKKPPVIDYPFFTDDNTKVSMETFNIIKRRQQSSQKHALKYDVNQSLVIQQTKEQKVISYRQQNAKLSYSNFYTSADLSHLSKNTGRIKSGRLAKPFSLNITKLQQASKDRKQFFQNCSFVKDKQFNKTEYSTLLNKTLGDNQRSQHSRTRSNKSRNAKMNQSNYVVKNQTLFSKSLFQKRLFRNMKNQQMNKLERQIRRKQDIFRETQEFSQLFKNSENSFRSFN